MNKSLLKKLQDNPDLDINEIRQALLSSYGLVRGSAIFVLAKRFRENPESLKGMEGELLTILKSLVENHHNNDMEILGIYISDKALLCIKEINTPEAQEYFQNKFQVLSDDADSRVKHLESMWDGILDRWYENTNDTSR